ncbi:MAG: type II toxin-antitoxin system VapC family toxin [Planctomycetes bacterium]|nr:type II toxin-antitoxin system VapC family toxin [Planctomycetota bacterium]
MKPRVYIETTIPSYLAARPTRDLIVAAHQEITRQWWLERRNKFDLFISQFVINEAGDGDREAAKDRLRLLHGLAVLEVSDRVTSLAELLIARSVVPPRAAADAAHIAVAAVHAMDFLVTWNCAHLANAMMATEIARVCALAGCKCPVICTPEALLED